MMTQLIVAVSTGSKEERVNNVIGYNAAIQLTSFLQLAENLHAILAAVVTRSSATA